jgi:hypothetical protein
LRAEFPIGAVAYQEIGGIGLGLRQPSGVGAGAAQRLRLGGMREEAENGEEEK